MSVEIYDPKCCEDQNLHEYSDNCDCCINVCGDCAEPMTMWNSYSCGSCGKSFAENQGEISTDSENHESFKCDSCIKESK